MGIDRSTLSFLAAARERGVSFAETVTIGRQALSSVPVTSLGSLPPMAC